MLDNKGFDLWADGYDKDVGISDEENIYPFAGYKDVLGKIYNTIMQKSNTKVLDIGFGTGTLATKLYENGHLIYGQDFSERMFELASTKMPKAKLYQGDFSLELVKPLMKEKYDFIVATYSLHHLTDNQKYNFIHTLLDLLNEDGKILIGDIAFETNEDLNRCKEELGDEWDEDEFYFVKEEFEKQFSNITFEKISYCAALITLNK